LIDPIYSRRLPSDERDTQPETKGHIERALQLAAPLAKPAGAPTELPRAFQRSATFVEPPRLVGTDWTALREAVVPPEAIDAHRLVSLTRSDPAYHAFDVLRTRVIQLMRQNGWKKVAITSPTPECGKTTVGINLAFSLARQGDCRTVLVDFDLRRPRIARVLGMPDTPSMEAVLGGKATLTEVSRRFGHNLAVAASRHHVDLPAELLQSAASRQFIADIERKLAPDFIVFDLPPMLASDDVAAFLPNVDCIILVAAAEQSTRSEIDLCERQLSETGNLLGVVLNKCHFTPEKYGY
jgi:protein-tyrosine kinase